MRSYGGLPEPRGSKLALLKKRLMLTIVCRLSWSISSDFDAVHSWNVCGSYKSRNKSLKTPILGFKVAQGHRCWYPRKARQQCLLWCAASLCLSAAVVLLDWTTVAGLKQFWRGTQLWCIRTEDSFEPRGSSLTPLKSKFNAEHFVCRLLWSILNSFGAIQS